MRFGLGVLGLPSDVFWAMTPPEFAAAVAGRCGHSSNAEGMTAQRLSNLMQQFPDKEVADEP